MYRWIVALVVAVVAASCAGDDARSPDAVDTGIIDDVARDGSGPPDDVAASDADTETDTASTDTATTDSEPADGGGGDAAPVDPCVPNPCDDAHRTTCIADGDDARCLCDPGYVDEAGVCVEATSGPCVPNPCDDAHRTTCVADGDDARCLCDPGYVDDDGACVRSGGVDACPDCPLDCGAGARCELTPAGAACLCERGYQDHDGDGTCAPSCATADLDCGDRACSDRSGTAQCVDADKPPIYVAFHWHMHQPRYWPGESIDETEARHQAEMGYSFYRIHSDRTGPYTTWPRDAIAAGRHLPHLGAQVSVSGSLIENLDTLERVGAGFFDWTAPWIEANGWTTSLGNPRLDLVRFGFHHPLMALLDEPDARMHLRAHDRMLERTFGASTSRGIFPPECAFSERMIPALVGEGIEWSLVDNIHFDRAHVDYPWVAGSNLPVPNGADARETADVEWVQLRDLWAPGEVAVPWGYQPHHVEYRDPATCEVTRMIAVPAARYEGNEDARGGFGALNYERVFAQYEALNTDPDHPMLVVLHHDGDNYGGGTEAYYHGNFAAFVAWIESQPDRFVATTVQDYLDQFPPDAGDVIHVEDGSWSGADNGDPEFHKWNGDPGPDGYSSDRVSWAVVTAAKNRVLTAEALAPHTSIDAIIDADGTATDLGWHHLLGAQASDYWYWDGQPVWDTHATRAANLAIDAVAPVLSGADDRVPPTIYLPQREPWLPGVDDAPAAFAVWTLVDDVSGVASVTLHHRVDAGGTVDREDAAYGHDDWTTQAMAGASLDPRTTETPRAIADRFEAEIDAGSGVLVHYFVEAVDAHGHVARSPVMHAQVGTTGGLGPDDGLWSPAAPTRSDVIRIRWDQPASLHWGVDGWTLPPARYWPPGSVDFGDGMSIDSPLAGPDESGVWSIELGPFDGGDVARVDFVMHNADGTWALDDQVIPIAE